MSYFVLTVDNKQIKIPMQQYTLNENQQFVVIALDFDIYPDAFEFGVTDGVKTESIGKLSEQSFFFSAMTLNSLQRDNWDFTKYPDPEILLLTDLKNNPI